jgi:hypothetical protein
VLEAELPDIIWPDPAFRVPACMMADVIMLPVDEMPVVPTVMPVAVKPPVLTVAVV